MVHGVEQSCLGTIIRVFPTSAAWQVHRDKLRLARRRRLLSHIALSAAILILVGLEICYQYFNTIALWTAGASIFAYLAKSAYDHKKDIEAEHAQVEQMHAGFADTAWEVALDDGSSVILKGFQGERGDRVGVNFIGDWTPSIFNLRTDVGRMREQLSSQLEESNQRHLFFIFPRAYREFVDGETARIQEYLLTNSDKDGTAPL